MKQKRLIGVITIKNDLAVQSFSFKNYLPLGKPEILVKNLDIWGADEILINDISRTKYSLGPNYELLKKISGLRITTPIIYSGGIRNEVDAINTISSGADRILIENIFYKSPNIVKKISNKIGSQAIILSLPIINIKDNFFRYCYLDKKYEKVDENINLFFKEKIISECLITDVKNEGSKDNFNIKILEKLNFKFPFIVFGGVGSIKIIKTCIKFKKLKGIAIGNSLNYQENSIDKFKTKKFKSIFRVNNSE